MYRSTVAATELILQCHIECHDAADLEPLACQALLLYPKPLLFTERSYSPGGTLRKMYRPASLVVVLCVASAAYPYRSTAHSDYGCALLVCHKSEYSTR